MGILKHSGVSGLSDSGNEFPTDVLRLAGLMGSGREILVSWSFSYYRFCFFDQTPFFMEIRRCIEFYYPCCPWSCRFPATLRRRPMPQRLRSRVAVTVATVPIASAAIAAACKVILARAVPIAIARTAAAWRREPVRAVPIAPAKTVAASTAALARAVPTVIARVAAAASKRASV